LSWVGESILRLQRPVAAQVDNLDPTIVKDAGHQQSSVAVSRIFFRTHHGETEALNSSLKSLDTAEEERSLGQAPVEHVPLFVVKFLCVGAPTQLAPQESVSQAGSRQRLLELAAVEVWGEAAVRMRTDVGDGVNPLSAQKIDEMLDRLVRMSDREQCVFKSLRHGPRR